MLPQKPVISIINAGRRCLLNADDPATHAHTPPLNPKCFLVQPQAARRTRSLLAAMKSCVARRSRRVNSFFAEAIARSSALIIGKMCCRRRRNASCRIHARLDSHRHQIPSSGVRTTASNWCPRLRLSLLPDSKATTSTATLKHPPRFRPHSYILGGKTRAATTPLCEAVCEKKRSSPCSWLRSPRKSITNRRKSRIDRAKHSNRARGDRFARVNDRRRVF